MPKLKGKSSSSPRKRIPSPRLAAGSRRAKVFWSGRSQAIRLPKEFRFDTPEVVIHREGDRVVLEPLHIERDSMGWPLAFWQLAGAAPDFDLGERGLPHERNDVLGRGR